MTNVRHSSSYSEGRYVTDETLALPEVTVSVRESVSSVQISREDRARGVGAYDGYLPSLLRSPS